jgi:hypothetical protein
MTLPRKCQAGSMGAAPMTPEEKARVEIDKQLKACGREVQDKEHVSLTAARVP